MLKSPIVVPSLIIAAGASGVGKTSALLEYVREVPDLSLITIDMHRAPYHISNPLCVPSMDGHRATTKHDRGYPPLRDQVYASMFANGYFITLQQKSAICDSNYIKWLRDPRSPESFAARMTGFFKSTLGFSADDLTPLGRFRMPIIYCHVTNQEVAKERIFHRAMRSKKYFEQDMDKLWAIHDAAGSVDQGRVDTLLVMHERRDQDGLRQEIDHKIWESYELKEPVTLDAMRDTLAEYVDVLTLDTTAPLKQQDHIAITRFLSRDVTLLDTGILRGERICQTMRRYSGE